MKKRFQNKTVFISGAAKRLGFEMAKAFAQQGANLVLHYFQSNEEMDRASEDLKGLGVKVWSVRADLTKEIEVASVLEKALGHCGNIDVIVHNASIFLSDSLRTARIEDVSKSVWLHGFAPLMISREFAKVAKPGSCVVTMLDGSLNRYQPRFFSYQMGKLILKHLTEMMSIEFAPTLRVNGLALGTFLNDPYFASSEVAKEFPIPRPGELNELMSALFFLVENEYVTGEVVHVDGGLHLKHGRLST